ncbi:monovalent cation/H+ antiporter subunit E [Thermococcus alcaliphilus]|uniref:monovalent cation/H+ antiporter subunit E n=1 Tax=Thermococcus alcaliphilus TaxID=139207 RepID=UPI002090EEC8|nr:monovalent cation/H+ antiporter subunit E [Thermococcus alcaliphilus]MCO6041517.1 monovalent cation/H+ antiporter subunit E [Thermococcus alcaliphilus]
MSFIVAFIWSLVLWLVLTAGTKGMLWSTEEVIAGIIFAMIIGFSTRNIIGEKTQRFLNPVKWLGFIVYALGPLFWGMVKANLDVAYRVITGKIKPGIVRVPVDLENEAQYTILSNSITLTPGTLTVDACPEEKALYVHWIYVKEEEPESSEPVAGSFEKWARRLGR